jgi:hypothetical protein
MQTHAQRLALENRHWDYQTKQHKQVFPKGLRLQFDDEASILNVIYAVDKTISEKRAGFQ